MAEDKNKHHLSGKLDRVRNRSNFKCTNITYFRLHVSPVEVERKKRQLELEKKKSEHTSQVNQRTKRDTTEVNAELFEPNENLRNRRQTTDPDQLCPTVASFVMPRAAVNAKGK